MLEEYFRSALTQTRLVSGPSSAFMEEFIESLRAYGFAGRTIGRHVRAAAHVGV